MNPQRGTVMAATILMIAGAAWPMVARTQSPDPLPALLNEVHQLRVAMERATTTTPQIQLLAARLSVQNERLSTATRDVAEVRREIDQISSAAASAKGEESRFEEQLAAETDPVRRGAIGHRQNEAKQAVEQLSAKEQRLRAREAELSTTLAAEETQWMELNRRLDDLERELASRRPK